MPTPLAAMEGVAKHYPALGGGAPLTVLRDIQLELQPGDSVAITGPSGSGKSTLLNILGTLDRPSAGRVRLEGEDLGGLDDVALAQVRNRKIGWVFQAHHLLPQCSVLENVLVPTLAGHGRASAGEPVDLARRLLARVGLETRAEHRPGQLSGGERQRVAVVRALVNQPRLLLADEPTGSLDRETAAGLVQLLLELNREQGLALVIVTHAPMVARRLDRVLELRDGALRAGSMTD